jgi:RNA recognition motif-containing protein
MTPRRVADPKDRAGGRDLEAAPREGAPGVREVGTRLYVGNLPFSADESQIRDLFAQGGRTVNEVKLVTDRDTGRPRGFGFVEMGSSEEADGAIRDLNGYEFGGRALTVNEARERTGGGGGGFGGGGGRGGRNRY